MGGAHTASKKAYRCSLGEKSLRIGIVAATLKDLVDTGCQRLKIRKTDLQHLSLEDGTIVDDDEYFQSLTANTVIYFVRRLALPPSSKSECLKAALETLTSMPREELLRASREPLLRQHAELLQTAAKKLNHAETKGADPSWFEGVISGATTKSEVMEQSAKARLRGYLFEARRKVQEASGLTTEQKDLLLAQLSRFQRRLSEAAWHGHYFSRKRRKPDTFCNSEGRFDCEGTHSKDCCEHGHLINPYSCKEDRILFSTWNLDHQIEKSREILPEMLKAAAAARTSDPVNWDYFYELLFTRENLRLVHIVCHDKRGHKKFKCDTDKIYA